MSRRVQHVSGYYRSNGTYVNGYTRSVPASSSRSSSVQHVSGYYRSNGTYVDSYTRSVPASSSSGTKTQCYVDNVQNRRLGRVGKPLGSHVLHQNGAVTIKEPANTTTYSTKHRPGTGAVSREQCNQTTEGVTTTSRKIPPTDASNSDDRKPISSYRGEPLGKHSHVILYGELHLEKDPIGSGSYGDVYKGVWKGRQVAYKKLKLQQIMTRKRKQSFSAEVTILAALDHPNTVQMFGIVDEEGKYGIVMEYLIRTLHRAIFIDDDEFSAVKKKKIVSQIGSALAYLHTYRGKDKCISHGDLKNANILLDKDDIPKLADFGLSKLKSATSSSQSTVGGTRQGGTPRYSAPEVLRGEILTMNQRLQADIYSLGIVVFEVLLEEEAFEDLDERQLQANVGHGTLRPPVAELSRCMADLLTRCWDGDAQSRPTAEDFVKEWNSLTPC